MKSILAAVVASAALAAAPLASQAQFPAKPIRVVVPFPGGSATDTVTRILSNSVSQSKFSA